MSPTIKPIAFIKRNEIIVSRANSIRPRIFTSSDVTGQSSSRLLEAGMLIGMLGMTYPQNIQIGAQA